MNSQKTKSCFLFIGRASGIHVAEPSACCAKLPDLSAAYVLEIE